MSPSLQKHILSIAAGEEKPVSVPSPPGIITLHVPPALHKGDIIASLYGQYYITEKNRGIAIMQDNPIKKVHLKYTDDSHTAVIICNALPFEAT